MKKLFPKITKIIIGLCFVVFVVTFVIYNIRKYNISKIENEINKMITGEVFSEVQYDDFVGQLKNYSTKPISQAALGTVYNRLAYMCEQDGDWLGYYSNFGKAVYYLEESGNYNDEINLYCDLVFYVYFANGNLDLAEKTMLKVDSLVHKCKNLNNQTDALVSQRHALLAYYLGNDEKALKEAEISKKTLKGVDAVYAPGFYNAAQFIIAKVNINKDDYALAEQLIQENKDSEAFVFGDTFSMINTNFIIPYYQLLAYVSAHNGDEKTVRLCIEQIIDRGYKYDYEYAVSDTLELLRKKNNFNQKFNMWLYEQELKANKEFISKKTQTYSSICNALIDSNREEISEKEKSHEKNMKMGHILIALVFFVILLTVFSIILRANLDTDVLTGVKNRRAFDRAIKKNTKTNKKYSVIMIDIDDFKKVNDSFGHAEGDLVLRKLGSIMLERAEDRRIVPYRYGGEEFSILIYDIYIDKTKDIAESLRYQIECQKWEKVQQITISAGFGDSVIQADKNLYIAKAKGKNQVI